ncbi:hypothetical protein AB0G33_41060, partial [Streptomyces rimosus]|uniref:hypothetical protein n=1 Tax=Streptomyces rimosus TaxID=1927 RepID=UPI0033C5842B
MTAWPASVRACCGASVLAPQRAAAREYGPGCAARPTWPDQGNKCGMTGQIMTCTVDVEQGAIFT